MRLPQSTAPVYPTRHDCDNAAPSALPDGETLEPTPRRRIAAMTGDQVASLERLAGGSVLGRRLFERSGQVRITAGGGGPFHGAYLTPD